MPSFFFSVCTCVRNALEMGCSPNKGSYHVSYGCSVSKLILNRKRLGGGGGGGEFGGEKGNGKARLFKAIYKEAK